MARNEYMSEAGPYVEAMRTVRAAKNLFFALLALVILFLVAVFCLVRYVGVLEGESALEWSNWLEWAFSFSAFVAVVGSAELAAGLDPSAAAYPPGQLKAAAADSKAQAYSAFGPFDLPL